MFGVQYKRQINAVRKRETDRPAASPNSAGSAGLFNVFSAQLSFP
jgi:hypothetical protein